MTYLFHRSKAPTFFELVLFWAQSRNVKGLPLMLTVALHEKLYARHLSCLVQYVDWQRLAVSERRPY